MTDRDLPIGIFDSGVGGLTVARAVLDQLPHEPLLYVGDTAHGPYGPLPIAEIRRHALAVLDDLVAQGVKLLVIACNTASAACLRDARERYDVPVVEVVLPAVRRAVAATRNGRVGVIGTAATVASGAYQDAFAAAPHIEVTAAACPRFVDFVERGYTRGRQVLGLANAYLAPLAAADVDTLVLGCTHYPMLTGVISLSMGDGVTLVNSAEETAKDVYRVLTAGDLLRDDPSAARPRRRGTGSWRPATRSRSTGWPAVSWVPTWARWTPLLCPRETHDRRLFRQRPRARTAPPRPTWSSTTATGCCSTSAAARSGRCSGISTRPRSTRSCCPTCTRTTASTWRRWSCSAGTACPPGRRGSRCSGRPVRTTGWRWRTTGRPGRPARPVRRGRGDTGERELGPFRLRFARVNHPVPTHAVRVTAAGHALAYSGDTGRATRWCPWPRTPTCCCARRRSTRTRPTRRTCT